MEGVLIIISLLVGYALGRYSRPEEKMEEYWEIVRKGAKSFSKDRPKPGVVNQLTEEQIAEKHDPIKKGNKEAFDRLFQLHPELLIEEYNVKSED